MQYSFERVSDILRKMVEHVFKDCIISFKAICSSTLNKFCLERKSLNGRSTLLMCVVFFITCCSAASLFALFDYETYEIMEHCFKLAYFARLFHGRSIP